jgi:hypothetical protein
MKSANENDDMNHKGIKTHCLYCNKTVAFKNKEDLQNHFIKHIEHELISLNGGVTNMCQTCKRQFKKKKNILSHLAKVHNKIASLLPDNLHTFFVPDSNKENNVEQLLEKIDIKNFKCTNIYKRKDQQLKYYSLCPWCNKLNLSIDQVSIIRHFALHCKDEVMASLTKKDQCNKCDKIIPDVSKLVMHIIVTHDLLEEFTAGRCVKVHRIPGTEKGMARVKPVDKVISPNNFMPEMPSGEKQIVCEEKSSRIENLRLLKPGCQINGDNLNLQIRPLKKSPLKKENQSPLKALDQQDTREFEDKHNIDSKKIKELLSKAGITNYTDIKYYVRKEIPMRFFAQCPWCNIVSVSMDQVSINKHFASHCKESIMATLEQPDQCNKCDKSFKTAFNMVMHLAVTHNLLESHSEGKCIEISEFDLKFVKSSAKKNKNASDTNQKPLEKDNSLQNENKEVGNTKDMMVVYGTLKEDKEVENSLAKRLLEILNLPSNTKVTDYSKLDQVPKFYILCPVCLKLLLSTDIRSMKQHYVIHFKSKILKEVEG